MSSLRRGGSISVFRFDGRLPGVHGEALARALQAQRFRSIETAAAEETSAGWVTAGDPTGESFAADDMDLDGPIWLQIRLDTKKLPARWLAVYRSAAERAAGRRLNGKERKELREDLIDKLLPRVLPTIRIVDVLLDPTGGRALLFSTGTGVRDEFSKLFRRSFPGVELHPGDPFEWARRTDLSPEQRTRLEEVAPVRWPQAGGARPVPAAGPIEAFDPSPDHS